MALRVESIEQQWPRPVPDPRPLIAVTTSEVRAGTAVTLTRHGEPRQVEMALGLKYLHAIESAGGIPVVLPPLQVDCLEPLLERVAGVCLSGGPDLDPNAYGERSHAHLGPTESQLDTFELALAKAADARGLPILAICRGMQLLNVARGGTLHQHLPDVVGERITHRQSEVGERPTHWVTLAASSRVSRILVRQRTKVNSFHHQAIATLGAGLAVTGRASDGTIECVEAVDRDFVVGVQWHAECLVDRFGVNALFRAFVEASSQFEQAPARIDGASTPSEETAARFADVA